MFAPKNDGVYYRRCRQPGSDFDETRSMRGYGPKTKCWTPVLTVRVSTGCLGGSKGADFDRSKKRVFGQIFFSSNRTERFAMAFSQVFSQWLSSFKIFLDISKFGRFLFRQNFGPPGHIMTFRKGGGRSGFFRNMGFWYHWSRWDLPINFPIFFWKYLVRKVESYMARFRRLNFPPLRVV